MITTTIYKIITSELIKQGKHFFRNPDTNKIVYLSDDSFMDKIINYDEDVDDIVNLVFFNNNYLSNNEADIAFKYLWVSKFLNRQIKYQSLSLFSAKNTALFYQNANIILSYFKNFDKYLLNYSETEQTSENNGQTDFISNNNRNDINNQNSITSTLPQTEINMDTNNDNLPFADNNIITKGKNNSNSETKTKNINKGQGKNRTNNLQYDLNKLILYKKSNILDDILNDFDKECFLQIW